MILHIFSDSSYTYKYIDFVNSTWDPHDHEFVVLTMENSRFKEYYHHTANCHPVSGRLSFLHYAALFLKARKVIFHQLNQPRLLLILSLLYPSVFYKGVWSIWGGDVYFHRYKTKSIKDNLIEKIMGHVISKLPYITGYIPGDFEIIKTHYKTDAKYIKSKYLIPFDMEEVKELKSERKQDASTTIMVGNSADPLNEHVNAFAQLSRYKNEKIKILSVLSYGGSGQYVDKVIETGKSIFGEKFVPITDYMSFEEYLNFISSVDIAFFNHKRQQGLGNVVLFFALGKKVFISRNVTPYEYYKSIGISLFPTEQVPNMTFDEFIQIDEDAIEQNRAIIFDDVNLANIKNEWENVFNA